MQEPIPVVTSAPTSTAVLGSSDETLVLDASLGFKPTMITPYKMSFQEQLAPAMSFRDANGTLLRVWLNTKTNGDTVVDQDWSPRETTGSFQATVILSDSTFLQLRADGGAKGQNLTSGSLPTTKTLLNAVNGLDQLAQVLGPDWTQTAVIGTGSPLPFVGGFQVDYVGSTTPVLHTVVLQLGKGSGSIDAASLVFSDDLVTVGKAEALFERGAQGIPQMFSYIEGGRYFVLIGGAAFDGPDAYAQLMGHLVPTKAASVTAAASAG
jgi:hypothetical protein